MYTQLLRLGGRAAATRSWLAAQLGCPAAPGGGGPAAGGTPRGSFSGGGGSAWGEAPVASDTLQLLLDVLRTRPTAASSGGRGDAGSSGGDGAAGHAPDRATPWRRRSTLNSTSGEAAAAAAALGVSRLSLGGASAPPTGLSPRQEARLRLWLWRCVNELMRFAARYPTITPMGRFGAGVLGSSSFWHPTSVSRMPRHSCMWSPTNTHHSPHAPCRSGACVWSVVPCWLPGRRGG